MPAAKPLSKADILVALAKTKSNRAAARYMGVSYTHYKMWAKNYDATEEGYNNLFEQHLNQSGKGIPKFLKGHKDFNILDVCEGKISPSHFTPQKIKEKLIVEGHLEEQCTRCGYHERRVLDYRMPLILHFKDKNKMMGIRVWIHTSCILNGVSIENIIFNKCYGIVTKYSKQLQSSVGIYANDFLNAIARSRLNNEWEVYIDKKENTAFTYKKYKQMNTDVSIDSKIEVAITKELNIQELKRQVDDYDSDENEIINTSVEIAELNSYIRNPKKYRFDVSSGLSAINYIKVYEKYDMTGKVLYEIKYDKYIEWKEKGYLTGDVVANDILNIVIKNNSITEELNGIFKEEVLICLALIKWNYINMRLDMKQKFNKLLLNEGDNLICGKMKSVVISNWDKRELYNIDRIHTILEKYYGISGEIKDRMVKVIMGDYNIKRWIDNWIAIITKERTDSFNPIFVIEILKKVFNITKLKELPDKICPEKIDELELYEKSKETINKFKKSLGCKITPDPKTRKGAIFIKYLNEILKDTGYMYKAITKQRYIINYELVRVNVEIEVNGVKEKVVSDFWERIWDNNKLSFIDDDIDE